MLLIVYLYSIYVSEELFFVTNVRVFSVSF